MEEVAGIKMADVELTPPRWSLDHRPVPDLATTGSSSSLLVGRHHQGCGLHQCG